MNYTKVTLMAAASMMAFTTAAHAQDQAAEPPAETAETTTDAAADLAFLKAQVEALQNQINELQKKSDKTEATWKSADWAQGTKISGRMYFNFSNIDQKSNLAGLPSTGLPATNKTTNFELKRFYLGVDHKFNDIFSANLTTDVTWQTGVGAQLYIKKAYLEAKLSPALAVRLGANDMPWIPFVEGVYGYRHIEQTLSDRTKFGTSSDWGVHALGSFSNKLIEYDVAVVNGGGYRNPPGVGGTNRTRSLDVEGRINVNYAGFTAGIGGYTGKLANKKGAIVTPNTAQRLDALLAYKSDLFTVGAEYLYAKNWNNVLGTTLVNVKTNGYSFFGSVSPIPKWSAFARYDHEKPNKTIPGFNEDYFNVGIQYSPVKIVDLALVYKRDAIDNGALSTGNGTIGVAGVGSHGTYDEFGLFGQFRF